MAQIEGFHFGQLEEDPSSYNQVVISLRKYRVPFREIYESKARLSTRDCYAGFTNKLPEALSEIYSSEYSRPLRAVFVFKISPQPLSLIRGKLLEHTINWERTPSTFVAFDPFCIPVDKVLELTKIRDVYRLAHYGEELGDYSLDPISLTISKGWFRATKDHIVDVFNAHQHPFFLEAWLEEVIERGRILSEVELLAMLDKYDPFMGKKALRLLENLKIIG
ncbi:hypothetical protein [Candidatus Borrarchaeum sp.]|uniref:hypothetical protein n=1 Tax=Candidatus Borrarchaeum sp. TaxID=2846742 RepID=UPI00257E292B|nr:hypothetical protein [Candidatus Borrarchaeum sp.]